MDNQNNNKILHVNYSKSGGAGRAAKSISKLLAKSFSSDLVFKTEKSLRENPLVDLRTSFRSSIDNYILKESNFSGMYSYFRNISDTHLLAEINKFQGILHFHWLNGIISLSDITKINRTNKRIIWTIHDLNLITGGCHTNDNCESFHKSCDSCPAVKKVFQNLPIKRRMIIDKFWSENKDIRVIFPSKKIQEYYFRNSAFQPIINTVIPNPLRDNFYSFKRDRIVRKEYNKVIIGFVCEDLNDQNKNFQLILQHIERINIKEPSLEIELVAVGKKYRKMSDLASVNIRQLGNIKNVEKLIKIIASFDILVSPSKFESFGLNVAEANWLGIPSLVFKTHAASEYLSRVNSLLVADDEGSFFDNLYNLILNKPLRLELGVKCQAVVKDIFDPSKIAENYYNAYLEL